MAGIYRASTHDYRGYSPGNASSKPEDVDRARTGADLAQALGHGIRGDPPRLACGLERRFAEGQVGRERRGMGATRPVRGPVGIPLAGDLGRFATVEEEIDDPLAVSSGDDHGTWPEGENLPRQVLLRVLRIGTGEGARLGDVRRDHGRQGQQSLDQGRASLLVE